MRAQCAKLCSLGDKWMGNFYFQRFLFLLEIASFF